MQTPDPAVPVERQWVIQDIRWSLMELEEEQNHVRPQGFRLQALRIADKTRWLSENISQKQAESITQGLFPDNLEVLRKMVLDGFEATQSKQKQDVWVEVPAIGESTKEISLVIVCKEKYTERRFKILMKEQNDPTEWRLMLVCDELRKELEAMKALKNTVLVGHYPATPALSSGTAAVDVARVKLPAGRWLISYSFFYTVNATAGNWIYFQLMYGNTAVEGQGNRGGHYTNSPSNALTYPVPVSGMALLIANGHDEVYMRFTPYQSSPIFTNVIIAAHPVAA